MTLEMKLINQTDLDDVMSWVNDEDVAGRFEWYTGNTSRQEEQTVLEGIIRSEQDILYTARTTQGTYVGQVGLHDIKDGEARLAILVGNKEEWGRGYAQEMITYAINDAFNNQSIRFLYATPRLDNDKSQHLLEKCGFHIKKTQLKSYEFRGELLDLMYMGMHRDRDELHVAA